MNKIPKSSWILKREYFEVKLVKGFKEKMIQHIISLDGYSLQELQQDGFITAVEDWVYRSENGVLELYQYPMEPNSQCFSAKIIEEESDYFERLDDNWIIPRHLFEVVR